MSSSSQFAGIGVGVVGLGGMGQLHASTVQELGGNVVAGADISADARNAFSATFDAACYEHHDQLIADDAVQAVIVTTPNRFHEPITIAALEEGCHVLVEKPLAHSLDSARRIADAAHRSDTTCMVGFHNRHAGSAQLFDAQRAADRFGDVRHVEANYVRRRGIPGTGSWFTDPSLAGGGALIDIGVHALDLALYAMGFPEVIEVSGTTRTGFGNRETYADPDGFGSVSDGGLSEVEDSVTAFVRCEGGRTISLEAAWASNREPSMDLYVRGEGAGAHFEIGDSDCRILDTGVAGIDHYEDVVLSGDSSVAGYRVQDEQFLSCVANGAAPETNTIAEALCVQRVIDAIYESAAQNRAIELESYQHQTSTRQTPHARL